MKVDRENLIRFIGCCGAYCKTCKAFIEGFCKSCKLGYDEGERDINKAKCRMKMCCFKEKKLETCADCSNYTECRIIHDFIEKTDSNTKSMNKLLNLLEKMGIPLSLN